MKYLQIYVQGCSAQWARQSASSFGSIKVNQTQGLTLQFFNKDYVCFSLKVIIRFILNILEDIDTHTLRMI